MKNSIRRSKSARKANPASKAALSRYLAAGLGATGLASVECEAEIVNVNITNIGSNNQNISGPNAGIPAGSQTKSVNNFPIAGAPFPDRNTIVFRNTHYEFENYSIFYKGLQTSGPGYGSARVQFATGGTYASPFKFTEAGTNLVGPSLPEGAVWDVNSFYNSLFRLEQGDYNWYPFFLPYSAPDWGPGSYIGFRARPTDTSTDWTYGYFEVTWTNATNTFEVLSGAYESTVNTAIAVQAVVPEPSAIALAGVGALALGAGAIRKARKARKAAAEGSLA